MCLKVVTMEVKEATLVMVVTEVDPAEDLGHPEDQVGKELLDHPEDRPEDRPEDQVEDHREHLEVGRLEDLVDSRRRVRPCMTQRRMVCSTSRRHLGTWLHNKEWRFRLTMNEGI